MSFSKVSAGALALVVSLGASGAAASYPAGVWVKVQNVVLEPNASAPTKIQIHGAAMLYDKSSGTSYSGYSEPALGYLYYSCPSGQEATCVSEWKDVEKNIAAGADVCVGLGDQSLPTGSLRSPSATPASPDAYPIAMGVLSGYTPCKVLESFLLGQPDAGTGGAGGSGGGGSAGQSTGGAAGSGGAASGGTASGGASSGGSSEDDGGCSVSGAGSPRFAWALALGAAAFALGRRRRS